MWDLIFNEKKSYFNLVKNSFFKKSDKRINWLSFIKNHETIEFLKEWFSHLPINILFVNDIDLNSDLKWNISFTNNLDKDLSLWFDFILVDNDFEWLNHYLSNWICPIIPKNNHLSSILKEFDPIKTKWNSYLYDDNNKWSIYYAVIRYLENYKFPQDNKNLVRNIISI